MSATLSQQARDYIFNKLVRGELEPGQRLSNRQIAREIGISFIPVREAINQLASEGLIMHRPKLGAFVALPNRQELAELYDLREALECHAAASGSIRSVDLDEMEKHNEVIGEIAEGLANATDDAVVAELNGRYVVADAAFHLSLLRAAGNTRAIKVVRDLRVMTLVFGHQRRDRPASDIKRVFGEHKNIIDALRRRDNERARAAMAEHIGRGCEIALEYFDRRRAEDVADAGTLPRRREYASDLQKRIHDMEDHVTRERGRSHTSRPGHPDRKPS